MPFATSALRLLGVVALLGGTLGGAVTPRRDSAALAAAYSPAIANTHYSASVELQLRPIATNRSWSADWLIFGSRRGGATEFVQVGLIADRSWGPAGYLFIASAKRDGPLEFERVIKVGSGPVAVSIAGDREAVTLYCEGHALRSFARDDYFRGESPVFYVGGEVNLRYDDIRGRITAFAVRGDSMPRERPAAIDVVTHDRGLELIATRPDTSFDVYGRFDPKAPSGY